jgi:hypothetical protein
LKADRRGYRKKKLKTQEREEMVTVSYDNVEK